MEATLNHL
jgi:flagellar biosynthesis chaperone FliJ